MAKKSAAAAPLIKGYRPVRLRLPDENDHTFFYVKEHSGDERHTLFVANCPTVPTVRTKLLLQSIFGRYGEVSRVTVIPNPRQTAAVNELQDWTSHYSAPTYHHHHHHANSQTSDGKFAHVVFTSTKEMKRTFQALHEAMSSSSSREKQTLPPALTLDTIELQTLADETDRQVREELNDDDGDDNENATKQTTGILAVAARYRSSCQRLADREGLLQECNAVMQAFEDVEAVERRKRDDDAVPDDDGFVTVTHSVTAGTKRALESAATSAAPTPHTDQRGRTSGLKRARKKKGLGGAEPLPDFYRFQTREHRKRSLQDLRQRFEEDLTRVKKMKEERQYRPF